MKLVGTPYTALYFSFISEQLVRFIDVDYSSSGNIMTNKFNQLLELNFATHFWLRCVWKLQTSSGL